MSHVDAVLADLQTALERRSARRARLRALRTATAGAAAALVLASTTAGLVADRPTTRTADAGAVLGLSGCERDAFGCLKLHKAPQD